MQNNFKYWNNSGSKKEFTIPFDLNLVPELKTTDSMIFDFGCGYGRTLNQLKSAGFTNIFGSDISMPMLERAKKTGASVLQSGARNIPFKNDSFDFVFLIAVLTCIVDSNRQLELVKEIKRILKPGAILFVADFLLNSDQRNLERYKKASAQSEDYGVFEIEEDVKLRHHAEEYLKNLFSDFHVISEERREFKTMNGNSSNGVYLIFRKK